MFKSFKTRRRVAGALIAAVMATASIAAVKGGFFLEAAADEAESSYCSMTAETDKTGNIFVGKTMTFKLLVTNTASSTLKGNIKYTVYGEDIKLGKQGAAVKSGTIDVRIPISATGTAVTVTDTFDKYGVYTVEFELKDSSDNTLCNAKSEFSLIAQAKQNPKMGFSQHALCNGKGTCENAAYFSNLFGMGIVRDDYPAVFIMDEYGNPVESKDYWGWKRVNDFSDKVIEAGIEPLAILAIGGDGDWPSKAGEDIMWPINTDMAENTKALEYLYNYCYKLAAELKGRVNIFEIFNEWSIYQEKVDTSEDAYAMCLKTAANAIRKANPKAEIVAMCSQNDTWVENVLIALGDNPGQYFDVISIHPYVYWTNTYPEQEPGSNRSDLKAFKRMLEKYGVADKPLYATEYGTSLHLPNWQEINQHTLAAYLIRNTVINGQFVDKQYVYTQYKKSYRKVPIDTSDPQLGSSLTERGFGVIRYCDKVTLSDADAEKYTVENLEEGQVAMAAFPSAVALAAYNSIMCNAEYKSDSIIRNGTDDTIYDYQYSTPDGEVCAVWDTTSDKKFAEARANHIWNIWSNDEFLSSSRNINIHIDEKAITVYDMYGNEERLTSSRGNYTITVGKEPIYIKAVTMDGLKVISDEEMSGENDDYVLPYTNFEWKMIFKDKSSNIGKTYKRGDGFGTEENEGKFFLFEMWN